MTPNFKNWKLLLLLDSDFDDKVAFVDESPKRQSKPKAVPHCDCRAANIAFGVMVPVKETAHDYYDMVPVEAPDGEHCKHCGYVTRLQAPVGKMTADKVSEFERLVAQEPRGLVVGFNLQTAEVVRFPSAEAAHNAGFGSVKYGIRTQKPIRGHLWRRTA